MRKTYFVLVLSMWELVTHPLRFLNWVQPMSSSQTRVDMINKDLRDVMNSADKDYTKKKQIDIRKNAKSLLLENFYIGDMHMTKTVWVEDSELTIVYEHGHHPVWGGVTIEHVEEPAPFVFSCWTNWGIGESRCPPLNLTPFDIPSIFLCSWTIESRGSVNSVALQIRRGSTLVALVVRYLYYLLQCSYSEYFSGAVAFRFV